jgi:hypothetical protein
MAYHGKSDDLSLSCNETNFNLLESVSAFSARVPPQCGLFLYLTLCYDAQQLLSGGYTMALWIFLAKHSRNRLEEHLVAWSGLRRSFLIALLSASALASCISDEERWPSEEVLNERQKAWEAEQVESTNQGRALMARVVTVSGPDQIYTIRWQGTGARDVIGAIELHENEFCADYRASTMRVSGYEGRWENYDVGSWPTLSRRCVGYAGIDRVKLGDERPERLRPE